MGEFGDKFRKAREKKGISLDDVANVTKISVRNLRAIEEQNFDQLPGGVFNKGFIRAYARHVGLNEEETVTEYLACLRQTQLEALPRPTAPSEPWPKVDRRQRTADRRAVQRRSAVAPPPEPQRSAPEIVELPELQLPRAEDVRPPRRIYPQAVEGRIPWRLVAAAIVVVVLGLVLWQRHERGAHAQEGPAVQPAPAGAPTSTPVAAPGAPTVAPANKTQTPSVNVPKTQGSQSSGQPAKPTAVVTDPAKSADSESPDKIAVPAAELASTAVKPAQKMTLVIRATENSWVSVSADGQTVSQETLIAPAHTSVHASREIVAKIGNTAGVSFVWNGQEIPIEGGESEVKTFVFDASGMRVLPVQAPANR